MNRAWKWIMHLNAKAFCFMTMIFFALTVCWSVYQYTTPPEKLKEGTGALPSPPEPLAIGLLDFVSGQLDSDDLSVPVSPFWVSLENLIADKDALAELKRQMENANNPQGRNGAKQDPFIGVRQQGNNPGAPGGDETKMCIPKVHNIVKYGDNPTKVQVSEDGCPLYDVEVGQTTRGGSKILSANNLRAGEVSVCLPDGSLTTIFTSPIIENQEL